MCGIAGVYHFDGRAADKNILWNMARAISHRGPDSVGVYAYKNMGIAHARLSIIDLSPSGNQPMSNEDETVYITYNGEIYNFQELRNELRKKGHKFKSGSDTEVVIHLYEEFGERFVDRLRGMFAFAIWDRRKERMFLVRDRLGIKPLYYYHRKNLLVFASEIKAILSHPFIEALPDENSIYEYINRRYVVGPDTLFKHISKIRPGESVSVGSNGINVRSYWTLEYRERPPDEEDLKQRLREIITESVGLRMVSDVPIGIFLSGGLDSSTITAIAASISDKPIKTFSVGFDDGISYDERKYARIVSDYFGTDHHELLVKPPSTNILEKIVWHLEEPIGDPAIVPTYQIAELTRKYVTVVLTGEGSDEMNAGYKKYLLGSYVQKYRQISEDLRRIFESKPLSPLMPLKIKKLFAYSKLSNRDYLKKTDFAFRADNSGGKLYRDDFLERIDPNVESAFWDKTLKEYSPGDLVHFLVHNDIRGWMVDDLLLKVDKMTMAHSLEARVPFLDHKFVEFSYSIPGNLKIKNFTTKYLLRKANHGLLPGAVLKRKQHGFNVPFRKWFKNDTKDFVYKMLTPQSINDRGYFKWAIIEEILQAHFSGKRNYSIQIFMLLLLELWHREFIDCKTSDSTGRKRFFRYS